MSIIKEGDKYSMVRVGMLACLAASIYFGWLAMTSEAGPTDTEVKLIGAFLISGFGGKVAQKYFETK